MSLVVDSQVHVWERSTPQRPWPPGHGEPQRPDPLTAAELLTEMDRAGVDRVILVPPSWQGDSNEVALEAARAHPSRFAVMGRFDVLSAPRPEPLRTWRDESGLLGVRLSLHTEAGAQALTRHDLDWFWLAAQESRVPVMVYAPGNLPAMDDVADRFPALRLVLCHGGLPINTRGDDVRGELERLWPLAKHDNVAVKASALPCYLPEAWPFPEQQRIVRRMIDTFGPKRVFWGSDLSRLPCPYRDLVAFFRNLDFLLPSEREWVLGRGVVEWLGWTEPAAETGSEP